MRAFSDLIADTIPAIQQQERISIKAILEVFHERGFGMPLFILSLPMALPIPVPPGINVLLALPLLLLTAQQFLARETIWLPHKIQSKQINAAKFSGILTKSLPFVQKLEWLMRPRLGFVTQGMYSRFIGLAGFIMALSICIPIPLSNTVPSFGIAIMALGVLTRDGLAVLAGILLGLAWVAMLSFVLVLLGTEGFDAIKDIIKSWI